MSLDLEPRDGDFVRYIEVLLVRQSLVENPGPVPTRANDESAAYRTIGQAAHASRTQGPPQTSGASANGAGAVLRETFVSSNGAFFFVLALLIGALFFAHAMIPVLAVILAICLGARNKTRRRGARGRQ